MTNDRPIPPQRFEAVPYQPDGGVPLGGLLLTVLFCGAAALVVAAVVSVVHQWFYLIVLFPIFMGSGVGIAGLIGIKVGKLRNPLVAGLLGLAAGVFVMLASYFGDYLLAPRELDRQGLGPQLQLDDLTFTQFVDLRAREGVTISRIGRSGRGINLGYIGSYVYWLGEIACAAGFAWFLMKGSTAEPFCSECQVWKESEVLGTLSVGRETVRAIMDEGDLPRLVEPGLLLGPPTTFTAHVCPQCGEAGTVEVIVKSITTDAKGEQTETDVGTWSFAAAALPSWRGVFATRGDGGVNVAD